MTHLKVAVRVRPLSRRELELGSESILAVESENTIAITNTKVPEKNAGDSRERIRRFTFDYCFHERTTQDDIFENLQQIIGDSIKRRHNTCVLAYGQSATGKTHTMMGQLEDQGIIPKLCQKVFDYFKVAVGDENTKMSVSFLEIYNEKVRDLLNDESTNKLLRIREHPIKGPYVQGLIEHPISDSANLLRLLYKGDGNRHVGITTTNPQSSRSHSVFTINCDGIKLNLIDLAGSERTGNRRYGTSGFHEGANINKSLVALGNVISALAEQTVTKTIIQDRRRRCYHRRPRFVPYRDSVLTWLLKDTLSGNSSTLMIVTISPSNVCYTETVNTLRFGQRAKLILTNPIVNEDPKEKIIKELRAEIVRLKQLLDVKFPKNLSQETIKMDHSNTDKTTTEKLIPLIDVAIEPKTLKKHTKLQRTFSVDHTPIRKSSSNTKLFGSQEKIQNPNKYGTLPRTRKNSDTIKTEKSTITDLKSFTKIQPKIDTNRRGASIKPRAQIVAAVTQRLYAKTKKKEIGVNTEELARTPKELTICSNARVRLKEITRRALKAHRNRNEETQTDAGVVVRLKETATDSSDLRLIANAVKDMEIGTDSIFVCDKATNCRFIDNFTEDSPRNSLIITRSRGTQSIEKPDNSAQPTVSFTKYLCSSNLPDNRLAVLTADNPLFTSSVNINISHNYIDNNENNMNFPTPDLISNHNSLEPHGNIDVGKINFPNFHLISDEFVTDFVEKIEIGQAQKIQTELPTSDVAQMEVFLPEICVIHDKFEKCPDLQDNPIILAQAKLIEMHSYNENSIKLIEPVVLKSIMKHFPEKISRGDSSDDSSVFEKDLPDSLEYHLVNCNKKVRFDRKQKKSNERMMKAMTNFLEEATQLMTNLTTTSTKFKENTGIQTDLDFLQTTKLPELPTNKYDALLETSCRRLEEKLHFTPLAHSTSMDRISQPFSYNPWDLSADNEDVSLESNPVTFSDYGSLPRRTHKRCRTPSCSPSAFLRQLTSMRRQVVQSSREELFHQHNY